MGRVVLADLVDRDDVRMVQRDNRARFLLETVEPFRIASEAQRQELERGLASASGVGGEINFAHAALAKWFEEPVMAEHPPNHQSGLLLCQHFCRDFRRRLGNKTV